MPPELDPATIQMGASSHPYTWTLEERGEIVVRFDNILLPDSTTNEPASNGWVTFRIAQQIDVPLGSVIENSVAIYFDFEEAVITNTAFHTVGKDFIMVTPSEEVFVAGVKIVAYPNPFKEQATFEIEGMEVRSGVFELVNSNGQLMSRQPFAGQQLLFERNDLPAGLYFYKMMNEEGRVLGTGKIVVQ